MCFVSLEKVLVDKKDKKLLMKKVIGAIKLYANNVEFYIKTHSNCDYANISFNYVYTAVFFYMLMSEEGSIR